MTLADITREHVLAAITEFDRLGRDAFLEEYKFGKALSYFLDHDGKRYDSKAIAGYARGGATPAAATLGVLGVFGRWQDDAVPRIQRYFVR
jgi:hypothetical protein